MDDLTTVKRLHYFDHQFLRADDFAAEQGYHVTMRRLHNQLLHSWGIADGLDVSFQGGATSVSVAAGVALDNLGREIVVPGDTTVELASYPAGKDIYLTIGYDEQESDQTAETGAEGNTRFTEQAVFAPLQNAPGDPGRQIVLAVVNRTGTEVTGIDPTQRRAAGAAGGSLDVLGLGFRDPSIVSTGWVRMRLEAANRALLQGTLHVSDAVAADGDVTIGGSLTVTGAIAAQGGTTVTGTADVRGQARVNSLAVSDGGGNVFQDNWIGMANNVDGTSKWLHVGGITDSGQRRIALMATRTYVSGSLGVGVAQPAQALHVSGNAIIANSFQGDVGHGVNWAGFSHSAQVSKTSYALLQSNDGVWTLLNKKSGGGAIQLRVDNNAILSALDNGNVGIGTATPAARLQVAGGAIMPAAGNAENAGILFPPDPGGGSGDRAFIRYFVEAGERTKLLVGIDNDADDRLSLWQMGGERLTVYNGMVGINQQTPGYTLHVQGTGYVSGDFAVAGRLTTGIPATPIRNPHFTTGEVHVSGPGGGGFSFGNRETADNAVDAQAGGRWVLYSTGNIARLWTSQTGDRISVDGSGNLWTAGDINCNRVNPRGGKLFYVADAFVNSNDETLEEGDVVVLGETRVSMFVGEGDKIPIPEVDRASKAGDTRVCGIVAEAHGESVATSKRKNAPQELREFTADEREELDTTQVEPGQVGTMVTLGTFATCKVDAGYGAIQTGDLLTTSDTPGHAMKVADPTQTVGAILGKALAPLAKGQGKIPVMVLLH